MRVVVDTSVWSLALRRNTQSEAMPVVNLLRDLITDEQVALLGAVRQEVLSGIRYVEQFTRLRDYLRAFPNVELTVSLCCFYNILTITQLIVWALAAAKVVSLCCFYNILTINRTTFVLFPM